MLLFDIGEQSMPNGCKLRLTEWENLSGIMIDPVRIFLSQQGSVSQEQQKPLTVAAH
jgi:hypothetical protein